MTADDQARLRNALDAAADGPVPDAWDAIRTRAGAGEPVPAAPRRNARWLAVAAALVVVAGGIALATRDTATPTSRADLDGAWCAALERPARSRVGVVVFVEPDATTDEVEAVRTVLSGSDLAGEPTYVDRDESYAEARRLFADQPTMLDVLQPEDVPTSFRTTIADLSDRPALDAALAGLPAVLESEVEPEALRSTFAAVTMLARSGYTAMTADRPVDPEVVDALVATAPDDLTTAVAAIAPILREGPTLATEPSPDATAIVADAEDRCGLSLDDALEPGLSEGATSTTGPTAGTADTVPVVPPVEGAEVTGWVVPVDLPTGWAVEAVEVGTNEVRDCGVDVSQAGVQWVDADGASVRVSLDRCADEVTPIPGFEDETVDLGDGTTGRVSWATSTSSDGGPAVGVDGPMVQWLGPEGVMLAEGRDDDLDTVVEVARHVVAAGGVDSPAPDGWTELDRWMARPSWPSVDVRFSTPEGNHVGYTMSPGGNGLGRGLLLRRPEVLATGGLAFSSVRQGSGWWAIRSLAPGRAVDVHVMLGVETEAGPEDEVEAEQLAASLRPVDAAAWQDFLATVPGDHGALSTADAPADLADADLDDLPTPSIPGPDGPAPTTTTQPS